MNSNLNKILKIRDKNLRKKKYRIKSKLRFTVFVACLLLVITFTTPTVLGASQSKNLSKQTYAEVVVESGDTLWQIAREFNPTDKDLRKVVDLILETNHITKNEMIQPGEILMIPVHSTK